MRTGSSARVLSPALLLLFAAVPAFAAAAPEAVSATPMVLIPAGEFEMSGPGGDEGPAAHPVRLDAFYLDIHEVTNAQYYEFCRATDRELPVLWGIDKLRSTLDYPDHPVIGVPWREAKAYAEWAGKRLPTEAEWEYAARGGLVGRQFDRGDDLTPDEANWKKSDLGGTVAVMSYAPNGYGLYDMVGNVREWCADRWSEDYFESGPEYDPRGPETGAQHVVRGGGWYSGKGCNSVHVRNPLQWSDFNVGFRCAQDAPGNP